MGMFVQSLADQRPGFNIIQVMCEMREEVDVYAFSDAWRQLVARHEVFRTSFHLTDAGESRQWVQTSAGSILNEFDWTGFPINERKAKLDNFLEWDRKRDFDPTKCPLMGLSIWKEEEKLFRFVWTVHHLLLDGSSLFLALNEVFAFYAAFRKARPLLLLPAHSFRKYVEWHGAPTWAKAELFWRAALKGFQAPTPLPYTCPAPSSSNKEDLWAEGQIEFPSSGRRSLETLAQVSGVTVNTVAPIAEYIEGARWTTVGRPLAPAALDREELVI